MNASNWISLGALAVAILVAIRGERNVRAEREAREKEDKRRDEELELLRRQASAAEAAQLGVCAGVQANGSERGIQYTICVQNTGAAAASEIAVELVDGSKTAVGTSALIPSLVPGERTYVTVMTPPRERYTGVYDIVFEWSDGRGRQRVVANVQVGPP